MASDKFGELGGLKMSNNEDLGDIGLEVTDSDFEGIEFDIDENELLGEDSTDFEFDEAELLAELSGGTEGESSEESNESSEDLDELGEFEFDIDESELVPKEVDDTDGSTDGLPEFDIELPEERVAPPKEKVAPPKEKVAPPKGFEPPKAVSKPSTKAAFDLEDDEIIDFGDSVVTDTDSIQLDDGSIQLDDDSIQLDDDSVDLDAEIAKLESELKNGDTDEIGSVDTVTNLANDGDDDTDFGFGSADDGAILDNNILMSDDFEVTSKDADFISPTGEIVVMDPTDTEDNFKLIYVDIESIAIVKRIRISSSVEDLVKSIKSTGLLKPIDVAPTSAEGVYVLLDGYRRIMACARSGKRRIPCVVNTRVSVPEIPILEAMYNHSKKYTIKEMIEYIDYLEKQKGIMSASMIEYLLQMNSGDYTKLKDILNDNDDEIVSKLMEGIYTIEMAFKKLEQRRKKESTDEKDLKKAAKVYEEDPESGAKSIEESGETGEEGTELTEDEIKSLAISAGDLDNVDEESLAEIVDEGNAVEGFKPHKQDPHYRERLDPALRKSILARDENTCQICKIISGMEFTEVLDVHHIQEVYLGGDDDINNLITACTVCHKLVHLYGRGELHMRPLDEMSESEAARFKRIAKLGNLIRRGMAMKGMKVDQLKKFDNAETIGRTKPGTGQEAG